jgi:hypothetical protein
MLLGQLLISILAAITVAVAALLSGWSLAGAFLIYTLSGSLTLVLLAAWTLVRADA